MVKSELIAILVADGLDPSIATASVDTMFETMAAHLGKGGRIEVRGFGSFSSRTYASRIQKSPRTGEAFGFSSSRRIHFEPGRNLKAIVATTALEQ